MVSISVNGRGFEPVSAQTQPVSGHSRSQISDIEKSLSRDSTRNLRPLAQSAQNSLPETGPVAANRRKYRLFSEFRNSAVRDRCGWLGRQQPHYVEQDNQTNRIGRCEKRRYRQIYRQFLWWPTGSRAPVEDAEPLCPASDRVGMTPSRPENIVPIPRGKAAG
jgi:hypothetical protein